MTTEQHENQKRWTAKRRSALVLEMLRGDTSMAEAARKRALIVAEIEEWRDRFLSGAENALRSKLLDEEAQRTQEVKRLKQKAGKLVMELAVVKEVVKGHPSGGTLTRNHSGTSDLWLSAPVGTLALWRRPRH